VLVDSTGISYRIIENDEWGEGRMRVLRLSDNALITLDISYAEKGLNVKYIPLTAEIRRLTGLTEV
jgi:hypothetical protein